MGKSSSPKDIESMSYQSMPPPPSYYPPPPKPWFPWLTPLIFLATIAMFVFTLYKNNCPASTGGDRCLLYSVLGRFSFQPLQENPLLGPSINTLKRYGALEKEAVVEDGEVWRLVSCIWLHAGVIHLFINMLSLLFIGTRLEQEFGFLKIGSLYVLSGFGGSLLSSLSINQSQNPTISVGASGALFGLLGAMLSELIINWTLYTNKCTAMMSLILIVALNLAVGFLPHVDNSAHIGGFLSGFLLGFVVLIRPQFGYVNPKYIPIGSDVKRVPRHTCYQYFLSIIALLLLISGYAYGLRSLYSKDPQAVERNTM